MGGDTPGNRLALGANAAVRPGRSPGLEAAEGTTLSARPGRSPGQDSARGASLAVRRKTGGPLGYLGVGDPTGKDRFELSKKRNQDLSVPHYAKGGNTHKKVREGLHSIYKILHSHFEGGPEPEIEKKRGGKLWIKDAINPKNKGALHKSLNVPQGKKIPLSKLEKAEHSKSPTLRKRAQLTETLRGFHR